MTSQSWGVELWDQGEGILKYSNDGLNTVDTIYKAVLDLIKLTTDVGKSYRKLAKAYLPKSSGKNQADVEFSLTVSFNEVLTSISNMGTNYDQAAESLRKEVAGELKTLIDDSKKKLNKLHADYEKLKANNRSQRSTLEKAFSKYRTGYQNMMKAHENYNKADEDKTLSRLEVDKVRQFWEARKVDYGKLRGDYATVLQNFNAYQRDFYCTQIPAWSAECEMLDSERLSKTKHLLAKVAEIERKNGVSVTDCAANIDTNLTKINASTDSTLLISNLRSGTVHPGDIEFVDLERDPQNQSTESIPGAAEVNMGTMSKKKGSLFKGMFSGKQVKEQSNELSQDELVKRISEFKKDIKKAKVEMEALKKLQDTYKKNPNLGDASSVDPNIEALSRRIQSLNEKLTSYEKQINSSGFNMDDSDDEFHDDNAPPPAQNAAPSQSARAPVTDVFPAVAEEPTVLMPVYCGSCTAMYSFQDEGEGYLAMNENDQFYILEPDANGWTLVTSLDNTRKGYVPTNYLEVLYYDT